MSNIDVISIGHGTAYVDNPTPNNGDIITIYAYADSGYQLLDIVMWDQNGYSIAVATAPVQQLQYNSSWGDCTIKVTFSHDIITVHDDGNGYAYVDNPNPNNGETVTLYAVANNKYQLYEIICMDSNGNVLWTSQSDTTPFTYDSSWGDITIEVYFELKFIFKNLWILFQRQWWRKNNY